MVWKLSHLERRFPLLRALPLLSPRSVLRHLQHRYTRNLHAAAPSLLQQVLQRDQAPGVAMCLCIAHV